MKTGTLKTGQPVKILETLEEYVQAEMELHENFYRLMTNNPNYQPTEDHKKKLINFFRNTWENTPPNVLTVILIETTRPFRPHIINLTSPL